MAGDGDHRRGRSRRPAREGGGARLGQPRDPAGLADVLDHAPDLVWVQLPFAGIEKLRPPDGRRAPVDVRQGGVRRAGRRAGARRSRSAACAGSARTPGPSAWEPPSAATSSAAGSRSSAAAGSPSPSSGSCGPSTATSRWSATGCSRWTARTTSSRRDRYSDALPGADVVFLALALTPETEGIISAGELSLMERHAWLDQRGSGRARRDRRPRRRPPRRRQIGGAGLDVTDPEPLPEGHVPVGAAQLPHHAPRRQHAGDGRAAARRAHHDERPPLRRGRGAARAGGRRARLLSPPEAADR